MIFFEWSLEIVVIISVIQCLIYVFGIRICFDLAVVKFSFLNILDIVFWRDLGGDVSSCFMVVERYSSVEFNFFNDNLVIGILFFFFELFINVEDLEDFLFAFLERFLYRFFIVELIRVFFLLQFSVGLIFSVVWYLSWFLLDFEELVFFLFRWIS